MRLTLALLAVLATAGSAGAKVVDSQVNGFEVSESVEIGAPASKVWNALGQIGSWWNSEHTFSGNASNLSIDLKPGGCFCEILPGGGVSHMLVVYARPDSVVRLSGALGPLQSTGASGHMTWTLKETAGQTTSFTLTYDVGGYAPGGLKKWAAPVDKVLGQQTTRLKRFVETK
jgi:uncharacterized protein YndB with AHSA1/START domain